jgi:hypothetical protein
MKNNSNQKNNVLNKCVKIWKEFTSIEEDPFIEMVKSQSKQSINKNKLGNWNLEEKFKK